jgi:hypothetical protein
MDANEGSKMVTTHCQNRPTGRLRLFFRNTIEVIARVALGEPAKIVPARRFARLERREELRRAIRRGDVQRVRDELAKVQLTPDDLRRLGAKVPSAEAIQAWADEDWDEAHTVESHNI